MIIRIVQKYDAPERSSVLIARDAVPLDFLAKRGLMYTQDVSGQRLNSLGFAHRPDDQPPLEGFHLL